MRDTAKTFAISVFRRLPLVDKLASVVLGGVVVRRFLESDIGRHYNVSRRAKLDLLREFQTIHRHVTSATSWLYYVVMAGEILSVPPSVQGDVIECGCYNGASTASLSLVCNLVRRRLYVCDSFVGLPEDEAGAVHTYPALRATTTYSKGLFAGSLPEVQRNIASYGDLSVCEFVPGFFADTLPLIKKTLVFGFLDVDLASSMRDCVKHLWPLLVDQGYFYTDDSCDIELVKVWFDKDFWQRELGYEAPGYVGSGCGLPALSASYSSLGYAVKVANPDKSFSPVKFWL